MAQASTRRIRRAATIIASLGTAAVMANGGPAVAQLRSAGVEHDVVWAVAAAAPLPHVILDSELRQAQMTTRSGRSRSSRGDLPEIPIMIGDGGGGPHLSFIGLIDADPALPSLGGDRLSVADANTPLPVDRLYFNYRHLHNGEQTQVFQYGQGYDVERFVLGGERTSWDGLCSAEVRVPIDHRLNSTTGTVIVDDLGFVFPIAGGPPQEHGELGNISMVFKVLLVEREAFAISGGLGLTLPTAQDVTFDVALSTNVALPDLPGVTADTVDLLGNGTAMFNRISNETVFLSPFLAWLYAPRSRWFHQGFLQVEVAANPSSIASEAEGGDLFYADGFPTGFLEWRIRFPQRVDVFSQSLLRLNLGGGYIFHQDAGAAWLQKLAGLFEVHYTSTLQDANPSTLPIEIEDSLGVIPVQTLQFGNKANRVDIVNLVAGFEAQVGGFVVTNAVGVPIRDDADRSFDFQYSLQIQRPF